MDWQTPIAIAVVLAAGLYLVRTCIQPFSRGQGNCGSGCQGCCRNANSENPNNRDGSSLVNISNADSKD